MRVLEVAKDTAQIVIDGAVVDTIVHTEDGSAEHTFSGGRIVADRPPIAKVGGFHTEAHVCRASPDASAVEAYRRSTVAYNVATGYLILAVGATGAAEAVTGGLATALLVGTVAVTYYAWVDARNNMYADHAALTAHYVAC